MLVGAFALDRLNAKFWLLFIPKSHKRLKTGIHYIGKNLMYYTNCYSNWLKIHKYCSLAKCVLYLFSSLFFPFSFLFILHFLSIIFKTIITLHLFNIFMDTKHDTNVYKIYFKKITILQYYLINKIIANT